MTDARPDPKPAGRTEQKRQAVLAAATAAFLHTGFRGTSMDDIAATAKVSKQTVYKQFGDKERLFREIVEGVAGNADAVVAAIDGAFGDDEPRTVADLDRTLARVARVYLDGVLQPRVLSLRRLIIAEREQFPDLAAMYYAQAPLRGIDVLERRLAGYAAAGLIAADDLRLAAGQFAYLALSIAQDRAMFMPDELPDAAERDRLSQAASRTFLAAFGAVTAH